MITDICSRDPPPSLTQCPVQRSIQRRRCPAGSDLTKSCLMVIDESRTGPSVLRSVCNDEVYRDRERWVTSKCVVFCQIATKMFRKLLRQGLYATSTTQEHLARETGADRDLTYVRLSTISATVPDPWYICTCSRRSAYLVPVQVIARKDLSPKCHNYGSSALATISRRRRRQNIVAVAGDKMSPGDNLSSGPATYVSSKT